ncbi:MAG: alpha/beta hydrolase [Nitrospirota bacterium]
MRIVLAVGLTVLVAVVAVSGVMALQESSFLYFPSRDVIATPAQAGIAHHDRWITTEDGITLHAWHLPNPDAPRTVLDLHGNGGNLGDRVTQYARWYRMGLAVYAVDYRGYGRSHGAPAEQGLYRDARAAWADLTGALATAPERIVIAGRSLGSGPAVQLATEVRPAGLVLESPMTNIPEMARAVYPFLPVSLLVRSRFDNLRKIRDVACPVLVIHAEQDEIIPPSMGRRVFEAAHEPKQWASVPGGHNDFDDVSTDAYLAAWRTFLGSLPDPGTR